MKKITRRRRAQAALTAGVAALAVASTAIPAAYADVLHGAIAYSGNGSWGRALSYPTMAAADSTAVAACAQTDCKVLVDFTQCGAVAENATAYQGGYGATLAAAEADAMGRLPNSWIDVWGCN